MRRALHYWGPVVAWMLVIFAASSRPRVPYQQDVPDWASHAIVYLVLAVLAARAASPAAPPGPRVAAGVFAFCLAYGISDEWHQSFVPGRHPDPWDVVKDGVGAAAGIAIHRAWMRRAAAAGAPLS